MKISFFFSLICNRPVNWLCGGGMWECRCPCLLLRLPNDLHHRMLGQVDFINGGEGASMPGLINFCSVFFYSILRATTRLPSSQRVAGVKSCSVWNDPGVLILCWLLSAKVLPAWECEDLHVFQQRTDIPTNSSFGEQSMKHSSALLDCKFPPWSWAVVTTVEGFADFSKILSLTLNQIPSCWVPLM